MAASWIRCEDQMRLCIKRSEPSTLYKTALIPFHLLLKNYVELQNLHMTPGFVFRDLTSLVF